MRMGTAILSFNIFIFFHKKRQLFDLDLKRKKKNSQDCSKRIDHCKLPHGIHVLTETPSMLDY